MTEAAPQPAQNAPQGDWDSALANLRTRFPGTASDGVLFCVHKLEGDRDVGLTDIRDEARLRGIALSGRSLHSAKVLLGLAEPATRKPSRIPTAKEPKAPDAAPAESSSSLEDQLAVTLRQIQGAANAEADRLRTAIQEAIAVLGAALQAPNDAQG